MKKIFAFFILLTTILVSCGDGETEKEIEKVEIAPEIPDEDTFDYDTLHGMYIGDFAGSDIRIILNYVSSNNAIGYNIHKGLQRNISGKVSRSGDSVTMILQEPGDNEYDGKFTLLFVGNDLQPTGTWESFSEKIATKKFKLRKVVFKEAKNEDDINESNFSSYFNYLGDTLGHYEFHSDGLCLYKYYPDPDYENHLDQIVEIQGTWSLKGRKVSVDWQPNAVFPERKSELNIVRSEWGDFTLETNGLELYNYYYGP